jgi:hypothetical protein
MKPGTLEEWMSVVAKLGDENRRMREDLSELYEILSARYTREQVERPRISALLQRLEGYLAEKSHDERSE